MSSHGNRILVVLGVGEDFKARAARFNATDEAAVRKAAGLMGLRVGVAATPKTLELARKLPEGKLFEQSGKGLVPLVREELLYSLTEFLTFDETWISKGLITGPSSTPNSSLVKAADAIWSAIEVGSVVLVFDNSQPELPSWCAAIVTAISKDGETLTMRWRDFPGIKAFPFKTKLCGLLRPDIVS